MHFILSLVILLFVLIVALASGAEKKPVEKIPAVEITDETALKCINCHLQETQNIVGDWNLSKHYEDGIDCSYCHDEKHTSGNDVANVQIPTPDVCALCHGEKVDQFKSGKHAFAWAAMKAMPTFHNQPMALTEGMKGCGGCHKIGLKTEAEIKELKIRRTRFGGASCDSYHTRHTFSVEEAKSPEAYKTCHMGLIILNGKCIPHPSMA